MSASKDSKLVHPDAKHSALSHAVIGAFILLPFLSAFASYTSSRQLLLVIFLAIGLTPLIVVLGLKLKHDRSETHLAFLVWSLGLSLLWATTFLSNQLWGYDIFGEFFVFLQVFRTGVWNSAYTVAHPQYNSVLSVTILPTIIALVSGIDGIRVFEVLFPLVFSLVPVVLYKIFRKFLSPEGAFLSVFLFMAYPVFSTIMVSLARQEIAELLLVLVVWILASRKMSRTISGVLATTLLGVGFITAHYSLAFIFLPILFISFTVTMFRKAWRKAVSVTTFATLMLLLVVTLAWYSFVSGGASLLTLTTTLSRVSAGLTGDFSNLNARPTVALQAVGLENISPGFLHVVNRDIQLFVQVCLGLGFVAFGLKKGKTIIEQKMLPLIAAGFLFLGACVVLPFLAEALNFSRVYQIALLFISPCFAYGVALFDSAISRVVSLVSRPARFRLRVNPTILKGILAAAILFSYFIFVSGWTWAVTLDRPDSLVLDTHRIRYSNDFTMERNYFEHFAVASDIAGAHWLSYYDLSRPVCADISSRNHVLTAYAGFPPDRAVSGPYTEQFPYCTKDSYTYLSEFNTLSGIIYYGLNYEGATGGVYTSSVSVSSLPLLEMNLIYSNDGATVYG